MFIRFESCVKWYCFWIEYKIANRAPTNQCTLDFFVFFCGNYFVFFWYITIIFIRLYFYFWLYPIIQTVSLILKYHRYPFHQPNVTLITSRSVFLTIKDTICRTMKTSKRRTHLCICYISSNNKTLNARLLARVITGCHYT